MHIDENKRKEIIDLFLKQSFVLQESHSDLHKEIMKNKGTMGSFLLNVLRSSRGPDWSEFERRAAEIRNNVKAKKGDFNKYKNEVENLEEAEADVVDLIIKYLDHLDAVLYKLIRTLVLLVDISTGSSDEQSRGDFDRCWQEYMAECETYLAIGGELKGIIATYYAGPLSH